MKLPHLMDGKIGRASGKRHGVSGACAAVAELGMAGKLDNMEVNANRLLCAHKSLSSPKSPYDDAGFVENADGAVASDSCLADFAETNGMLAEDSGISEISLSLTDELEAEKILEDITERDESVDDVTDSEESIGSSGKDRAERIRDRVTSQLCEGPRSISQIRESLEQKVRRLRDEKAAVDEKIRLAQEEEDLRMREKTKLKQQLVVHRRDRLKKVIADLKRRLEDQSVRLQVTYSTLISLQRNIFRHRSFSRPNKAQHVGESSLEAPF